LKLSGAHMIFMDTTEQTKVEPEMSLA